MSDLVQRLRDAGAGGYKWDGSLFVEAADRIEALEGEINGTDHLAGDPTKWGLLARLEGTCMQRDDALNRIEALEAALREIACESGTHDRGRADCCIARRALEDKS